MALILFGVRYLRKGLDRLFGTVLGDLMQRITASRVRAFLSGIALSIAAPSSTTVSMLAVQTVQAGHMNARQALALMIGADIGLTVMVLLISMEVDQVAPVLVLFGVLLFQFTSASRSRGTGQVVLSLGFIFMGIATIKSASAAVAGNADMMQLIHIVEGYPMALAVAAAIGATVMQSSTATIGLVIGLGAVGAVRLPAALAVVAGANVGIGVTTLLVGWSRVESRRLAVGNLILKVAVASLTVVAIPWLVAVIEWVPGRFEYRVAGAHTGFNVVLALVGLPLVNPICDAVAYLIPRPVDRGRARFGPRYIDSGSATDSLSLALGQSKREILHAAEIVRGMLGDLWKAMKTDDARMVNDVSERDDEVDLLDREIKHYLTRQIDFQLDQSDAGEQMLQLRYLSEMETIGDIIDKNLCELVLKKIKLETDFSAEGWRELDDFYGRVVENMLIAGTAFTTRDRLLANQLMRHKERLNQEERELRDRHFARLNAGLNESMETSAIHLDLLTHLKRINSCVSHVAYAILEDGKHDGGG